MIAGTSIRPERISALAPGFGSSQPDSSVANRLARAARVASGDSPVLPNLQPGAHEAAMTP
jgi:hypothetical protein